MQARRAALVLGFLLVACAGAAGAEGLTGVLPIAGAPELDRELERLLGERCGRTVLGATRTLARITRSRSRALDELRGKLELAEGAALRMSRALALSAAGEAAVGLQQLAAEYHAPALLARAWLARGFALLLRPPDEEGALAAFRAAAGLDAATRPDPDRVPPRAARLLERARATPAPLRAPRAAQLALLAESAGVSRIAWVTPAGDSAEVQVLTYERGTRILRTRVARARLARSVIQAGALCAERPRVVARPPARPAPNRPLTLTPGPPRLDRTWPADSPWYRRWWIWGIAGVVLVGTGVTVAIVTTRR